MQIRKGDKVAHIPNWVVVIAILAVDNAVANVCNTKRFCEKLRLEKELKEEN